MCETIGAGVRIKEWREKNSLSVKDLCEVLEITGSTLADIEADNQDPSCEVIIKLAKHTSINSHWMLTGEWSIKRYTQGIY